jgi:hypothetical protein
MNLAVLLNSVFGVINLYLAMMSENEIWWINVLVGVLCIGAAYTELGRNND